MIHDIDKVKKRRKKKRERQELKLKEIAPSPSAKKSQAPLNTISGLSREEQEKDIPSKHKESKIEMGYEFERKERRQKHESIQQAYDKLRLEKLERLAVERKE